MDNQRFGGKLLDLVDGCVAILVQDWNVVDDNGNPLPIPSVHLDVLDELSIEDYETLVGHEWVRQTSERILKLRSETITPDDYDKPDSPTEPSAESAPGLREEASPKTATAGLNGTTPKSTLRSRSGGTGTRTK